MKTIIKKIIASFFTCVCLIFFFIFALLSVLPRHLSWSNTNGIWMIDGWHLRFRPDGFYFVIDQGVFRSFESRSLVDNKESSVSILLCLGQVLSFFHPKCVLEVRDGQYDGIFVSNLRCRLQMQPQKIIVDRGYCQYIHSPRSKISGHTINFFFQKTGDQQWDCELEHLLFQVDSGEIWNVRKIQSQFCAQDLIVTLDLDEVGSVWTLRLNPSVHQGLWSDGTHTVEFDFLESKPDCYTFRNLFLDGFVSPFRDLEVFLTEATVDWKALRWDLDCDLIYQRSVLAQAQFQGDFFSDYYHIVVEQKNAQYHLKNFSAECLFSSREIFEGQADFSYRDEPYSVMFSDLDQTFFLMDLKKNCLGSWSLSQKELQWKSDDLEATWDLETVFPLSVHSSISYKNYGSFSGVLRAQGDNIVFTFQELRPVFQENILSDESCVVIDWKKKYALGHLNCLDEIYEFGLRAQRDPKKFWMKSSFLDLSADLSDQTLMCSVFDIDLESLRSYQEFFSDVWNRLGSMYTQNPSIPSVFSIDFKIDKCRYPYGQAHHLHGSLSMHDDEMLYQLYGSQFSFIYQYNQHRGDGAFMIHQIGAYTSVMDGGPLYLSFYHDHLPEMKWHVHAQDLFLPQVTNEHFTGLNILSGQIFHEQQLRSLWYQGVSFNKIALSGSVNSSLWTIEEGFGQAGCLTIYPQGFYDRLSQNWDLILAIRPQVSEALTSVLALLQPWTMGITLPGVHSWGTQINQWNEELYVLRGSFQNWSIAPYEPQIISLDKN